MHTCINESHLHLCTIQMPEQTTGANIEALIENDQPFISSPKYICTCFKSSQLHLCFIQTPEKTTGAKIEALIENNYLIILKPKVHPHAFQQITFTSLLRSSASTNYWSKNTIPNRELLANCFKARRIYARVSTNHSFITVSSKTGTNY